MCQIMITITDTAGCRQHVWVQLPAPDAPFVVEFALVGGRVEAERWTGTGRQLTSPRQAAV